MTVDNSFANHGPKQVNWEPREADMYWDSEWGKATTTDTRKWTYPPKYILDSKAYRADPKAAIEMGRQYGLFTTTLELYYQRKYGHNPTNKQTR